MKHKIFAIGGVSAAGKTTVIEALPPIFREVKSYSTRSKRSPTDCQRNYISRAEYIAMRASKVFLEDIEYDSHLYGIVKAEVNEVLNDHICVLDLAKEGLLQVINAQVAPVTSVFLVAEPEELYRRLVNRPDSDPNVVRRRMHRMLTEAEDSKDYMWIFRNVRTEETVEKILKIFTGVPIQSDAFDAQEFKRQVERILCKL